MITLNFGHQLHVKLPRVFRYMHETYIEQFFSTGVFRLGSFDKFRRYPDEVRGDKSEGGGSLLGKSDAFQLHLMTRVGENGYLLATSLEESEKLQEDFDVDSYFAINDPLNFAIAIASAMPGVTQVFVGYCNYQQERLIAKELDGLSVKDFTDEQGNFIIGGPGMNKRFSELVGNGIDLMFLKQKKYQYQAEFRIVWTINTKFFEMADHIDVVCKEAIQYCSRKAAQSDPL